MHTFWRAEKQLTNTIIAQIVHPEEMKNYKTPESLHKEITNRARKSYLLKSPNIPKGSEWIELKRRFLCLRFFVSSNILMYHCWHNHDFQIPSQWKSFGWILDFFSSRIKLKQKNTQINMLIKKYYLIYQVFKLKRKQNTISASIIIIKEADCTNTNS